MKNIFNSYYSWLLLAIALSVGVSFFVHIPAYLFIAPLFAYFYIKRNGLKNAMWILIPIAVILITYFVEGRFLTK